MDGWRVARFAGGFGRALALTLVFTLALASSLALHLNLPLARASLATRVTALLAPLLNGEIRIEHVGHIGARGVFGTRVAIVDPRGRRVALAEGVGARLSYARLLRSALFEEDFDFQITHATIDYVDLALDPDESGALQIVSALNVSPHEREKERPRRGARPGRGVNVTVSDMWLRHAWLHGEPEGVPPIDAELFDTGGFLAVRPGSVDTAFRSARLRARGMPYGANPSGTVSGRFMIPAGDGTSFWLGGSLDGDVGGMKTTSSATFDHGKLLFEVDASTSSEAKRSFAPEVRLPPHALFHADGFGVLPNVGIRAEARFERTVVDLDGDAAFKRGSEATFRFRVAHLDLRDVIDGGPRSDLGGAGALAVSDARGPFRGGFHVQTSPGSVEGLGVPKATILGHFVGDAASARASLDEPGAPVLADLRLDGSARGPVLHVNASATIPELARMRRLGSAFTAGSARLSALGSLELSTRRLDASITVDAEKLAHEVEVERARIDAELAGLLEAPEIHAMLRGGGVSFEGLRFGAFSGEVRGNPERADVSLALGDAHDRRRVSMTTEVDASTGPALRQLRARAGTGAASLELSAEALDLGGGGVRLSRGVLTGAGAPLLFDFASTRTRMDVHAHSTDVDLGRAATLLGSRRRIAGHLSVDVDLTASRATREGHVSLDLTRAGLFGGADASASLAATLRDRNVDGTIAARGALGELDARAENIRLGGSPEVPRSWATATGQIVLHGLANLTAFKKMLPEDALPVGELAGRLFVDGTLSRTRSTEFADVALALKTEGLTVGGLGAKKKPVDGARERGPSEWRSTQVDASVNVDSSSSESRVHGRLYDARGTIASVDGSSPLSLAVARERLRSAGRAAELPFRVSIGVPRRNIGELPAFFRAAGTRGTVEGTLEASQTARAPKLNVTGHLRGFEFRGHPAVNAVDVDVSADYADQIANGTVTARSANRGKSEPEEKVELSSRIEGDLPALLAHEHVPWDVTAHLAASNLPLETVPWLDDQRVRGLADGDLVFGGGSARAPEVHGRFESKHFDVGEARSNNVKLRVGMDAHTIDVVGHVEETDGSADAKATVGIDWPSFAARPHVSGPSHVTVDAHHFRATPLLPAVQAYFRTLDGRVDAKVRIDATSPDEPAQMEGYVKLTGGVLRFPNFGDDFRNVAANVKFEQKGVIRADDISAESDNGKVRGSVLLRTKGLGFDSGSATLKIPERDAWPVVVEGQTFAESWGTVSVDASHAREPGVIAVVATIPSAGVRLSAADPHALQELSPDAHVRVGMYREGAFVPLATERPREDRSESATSATVAMHIRDFEVRRGTELRVRVEGDPVVTTRGELRVEGILRLRSGFFEAEGKRFEMEKGTVSFSGDPYNPDVVATAGWTAPDGTRIHADFVGPLKTGTVTLRSDPARTKSEILSLILFGTTTGSGTPYAAGTTPVGAGAAGVASLGGQFATQGLSRALDSLTGLDITARIDTTDAANPRPEVEVRLARDISIAVAHVLGVPPPGTNPDRNFATFDWRFLRAWSIETTVGDQGSTVLDLVWQYRY